MNIYITDKDEVREIRLVKQDSDSRRWGSDFFDEISNLSFFFPISREDRIKHDASAAMTDAEYREEADWWEEQVRLYNEHDRSSWFTEDMDDEAVEEEFSLNSNLWLTE